MIRCGHKLSYLNNGDFYELEQNNIFEKVPYQLNHKISYWPYDMVYIHTGWYEPYDMNHMVWYETMSFPWSSLVTEQSKLVYSTHSEVKTYSSSAKNWLKTFFVEMYTWPGFVENLLRDPMRLNCGLRCRFRRVELNDGWSSNNFW